jgi:hypothetical protein
VERDEPCALKLRPEGTLTHRTLGLRVALWREMMRREQN